MSTKKEKDRTSIKSNKSSNIINDDILNSSQISNNSQTYCSDNIIKLFFRFGNQKECVNNVNLNKKFSRCIKDLILIKKEFPNTNPKDLYYYDENMSQIDINKTIKHNKLHDGECITVIK